ncbi:hypothetical protein TNCV_2915831 [Trichonephila clavipes]|nr:hypothetical protein TNCV_2915831 [Trichonephila clavipes]
MQRDNSGRMEQTNHHRTWGHKPHSFSESRNNRSRSLPCGFAQRCTCHCIPEHCVAKPPPCYVSRRGIGYGRPVAFHPHSPDLNPLDFSSGAT